MRHRPLWRVTSVSNDEKKDAFHIISKRSLKSCTIVCKRRLGARFKLWKRTRVLRIWKATVGHIDFIKANSKKLMPITGKMFFNVTHPFTPILIKSRLSHRVQADINHSLLFFFLWADYLPAKFHKHFTRCSLRVLIKFVCVSALIILIKRPPRLQLSSFH